MATHFAAGIWFDANKVEDRDQHERRYQQKCDAEISPWLPCSGTAACSAIAPNAMPRPIVIRWIMLKNVLAALILAGGTLQVGDWDDAGCAGMQARLCLVAGPYAAPIYYSSFDDIFQERRVQNETQNETSETVHTLS